MPLGKGGPLVLSSIQTLPLQLCCVFGYLVELMHLGPIGIPGSDNWTASALILFGVVAAAAAAAAAEHQAGKCCTTQHYLQTTAVLGRCTVSSWQST
jgi:hypothetical protein